MVSDEAFTSLLTQAGNSDGQSDADSLQQFGREKETSEAGIAAEYGSEESGAQSDAHEQDESELDEMMQELEEDELQRADLKMPSDLSDDMDSLGDDEEEGEGFPQDEEGSFPSYGNEEQEEPAAAGEADSGSDQDAAVEQLFEEANDAQEMDLAHHIVSKKGKFVNEDLVGKIEQIEDEMMQAKSWQMTGEVKASERPVNSLLEVHLDFNTATKLPPTITRETTNAIESLVKQRVLDELFDDPVLLMGGPKRKSLNET